MKFTKSVFVLQLLIVLSVENSLLAARPEKGVPNTEISVSQTKKINDINNRILSKNNSVDNEEYIEKEEETSGSEYVEEVVEGFERTTAFPNTKCRSSLDFSVLNYISDLYKKGDDCKTINGVMRLYDDKTQEELKHVLEKYDRMDKSGLTAEEREDYEMKADDVRITSIQMFNNNRFYDIIHRIGEEKDTNGLLRLFNTVDISQLGRVFKEPYEKVLKEAQELCKTGKQEDLEKAYGILTKIKLIEGCENLVKYKVDDKIFEGKEVPDAILDNMVRLYLEAIRDTSIDAHNEKAIEKYLIDNVVRIDNNDYKEQEKIVKAALPYTKLYLLKYKEKEIREAATERVKREDEEKGVSFTITEKEIEERRKRMGTEMKKMREMYEKCKACYEHLNNEQSIHR